MDVNVKTLKVSAASLGNVSLKNLRSIVECTGITDVIEALKLAKKHRIIISTRGDSNNIVGRFIDNNVLLINLDITPRA